MRPIELLAFAAAIACTQGCSAVPHAAEPESRDVQKIAWTKGHDAAAFRDQHGVCHMFSRDTKAALAGLGEQVKACFEGSLPQVRVDKPEAKSVKVAWNKMPGDRINHAYAQTMAESALIMATSARRRSAAPQASVRGFFTHIAGVCHVVVPDQPGYAGTLGHEFKHCVDGLFHDEQGRWLQGDHAV